MGKRAKIVAEIEREVARMGDRPGLCLFYAHAAASVLWRTSAPGSDSGGLAPVAARAAERGRRRDEHAFRV